VGVLVADIKAARDRFASVTGLTFTEPETRRFANFDDSRGPRPLELTMCYSLEGPPYLELVQWDPHGGVFGSEHGEGLHHIGFHNDDVAAHLDGLGRNRVAIESRRFGNRRTDVLRAFITDPASLHGVRLEMVDDQGRIALEEWLDSLRR